MILNKYDEIMEKIEVTDEMRARILSRIDEAESEGLFVNLPDDPQHTQSDSISDSTSELSPENVSGRRPGRPVVRWLSASRKILPAAACLLLCFMLTSVPWLSQRRSSGSLSDSPGTKQDSNLSDSPGAQDDAQDDVQNGLSGDAGPDDIEDGLYDVKTFSDAKELSKEAGFSVSDISSLKKKAAESAYSLYDGEIAEITYTLSSQSVCLRKSPGSDDNSGIYEDYTDKKTIKDAGTKVSLQGNDGKYFLAAWVKKGYSYSIYAENGLSEKEMTQYVSETK